MNNNKYKPIIMCAFCDGTSFVRDGEFYYYIKCGNTFRYDGVLDEVSGVLSNESDDE